MLVFSTNTGLASKYSPGENSPADVGVFHQHLTPAQHDTLLPFSSTMAFFAPVCVGGKHQHGLGFENTVLARTPQSMLVFSTNIQPQPGMTPCYHFYQQWHSLLRFMLVENTNTGLALEYCPGENSPADVGVFHQHPTPAQHDTLLPFSSTMAFFAPVCVGGKHQHGLGFENTVLARTPQPMLVFSTNIQPKPGELSSARLIKNHITPLMPTISIIILTYNREELLLQTLQSVFAQSYTDFEIIILDDGSTDQTRQRIKELEHPAIRYYYTNHLGNLSQLRNLAWTYAKGEFIAFLDADDIWLPRKLERQLEVIKTNEKLAFVYTDVEEFNAKGVLRPRIYDQYQEQWTSMDQFELTLSGRMPIYASTVLLRRNLAERVGGFEDSLILGDTHYLLRLAQYHPCQVIFEPLVRIRKHDQNISVYKEREAYIEMLSLLAFFEQEKSLRPTEIHKYKAFYYRLLAQFDRRQGNWLPALKAYGQSLFYRLQARS